MSRKCGNPLQRDPEIALIAPNIQIVANRGAVELDGTVQSDEQKRQVEDIAKNATGVVAVNNQLKIISSQPPTGVDNSSNTPLNPTGSADMDSSTNNLLNPAPLPGGSDEIYQPSTPAENGQKP